MREKKACPKKSDDTEITEAADHNAFVQSYVDLQGINRVLDISDPN